MAKSFKDIKKELKKKDPEFYNEVMTEAAQEIEAIKKSWGGKRSNAGRPKIYSERKTITKQVSKDTIVKLKDYSEKHKISENEALDKLINAGYKHLQEG